MATILRWKKKDKEQMFKAHKQQAEERNAEAIKIVYGLPDAAGIEKTESVKKFLEAYVEAAVFALLKSKSV